MDQKLLTITKGQMERIKDGDIASFTANILRYGKSLPDSSSIEVSGVYSDEHSGNKLVVVEIEYRE